MRSPDGGFPGRCFTILLSGLYPARKHGALTVVLSGLINALKPPVSNRLAVAMLVPCVDVRIVIVADKLAAQGTIPSVLHG
jgi:hypothetical protein